MQLLFLINEMRIMEIKSSALEGMSLDLNTYILLLLKPVVYECM